MQLLYFCTKFACILLCITTSLTSAAPQKADVRKELVVVVFRHGARAPLGTFPRDPNKNHHWQYGFGQLTKQGRLAMHQIGEYLRKRYRTSLSFDPREVWARSSPEPRCFDSVALLLYGMYPIKEEYQRWKAGRDWQPVPIMSLPKHNDKYTFYCPRMIKTMLTTLLSSGGSQGKLNPVQRVAQLTGISPTESRKLLDATDAFLVQHENNLTLPDALRSQIPALKVLNDELYLLLGAALSPIMGGEMLRDIAEKVQSFFSPRGSKTVPGMKGFAPLDIPESDVTKKNLHLYSYHDLNVIAVMFSLNNSTLKERPPYGSTIFFEVKKPSGQNERQIEVFYRKGTEKRVPVRITGCPAPCTIPKFNDFVKKTFKPVTAEQCGVSEEQFVLL
ncbi:prostatic acid phosphatase-like [Ornithodoros turicata]|uniref:prostatic acid phosphatase-like n=1 Tax=Ornithodoros turicata TaxID=34597 RepID=UPI003138CF8A